MTQNEQIFSVLTSPNSTEITKLVLNNNTSICLYIMLFAITSKVWKKWKNFKINRENGRFKNNRPKSGRSLLYRKTWQVCTISGLLLNLVLDLRMLTCSHKCHSSCKQYRNHWLMILESLDYSCTNLLALQKNSWNKIFF